MRAAILSLFSIHLLFSQTYRLEGEILDASNKSPLPFANITLEGTSLGAASDENGRFTIEKINAGTYTMIASYMGYSTIKNPITIGKNLVGPFKDSTNELSNRFVVLETYFSSLLITNFENRPRKKRNKKKIKRAIIISEILIPDIPFFQTSINKFIN